MRVAHLAIVAAATLAACSPQAVDRSEVVRSSNAEAALSSTVVASVGERAVITRADVTEYVREHGGTVDEALMALVDATLAALEAEAARTPVDPSTTAQVDRTLVHELLTQVRDEVPPQGSSASDVRARYDALAARNTLPERRHVVHILAKGSGAAERAFAAAALRDLRTSAAPLEVVQQYKQRALAHQESFEVVAEDLPPMAEGDNFDAAFKDAVFAARGTGALAEPVHTSFGWHAIRVLDVVPAGVTPFESVEAEIRTVITNERRVARLRTLVDKLDSRASVKRFDDAIDLWVKRDSAQ